MKRFFARFKKLGQKGIVLPLVLTYAAVFTAELTGLAEYASHTQRLVQSQQNYTRSFYLAEAATEKSMAAIQNYINTNGIAPDAAAIATITAAPNITSSGSSYVSGTVGSIGGSWTNKTLTAGDYAGLSASTQTITLTATATDALGGVTHRTTVTQSVEVQLIPIFQFGVFYEEDLEILPGANMTFAGPVHTNGNLYVGNDGGSASTSFQSTITAHGTIIHGRKDGGSINNGGVNIMDNNNVYQPMYQSGSWLDSNSGNWASEALTRWTNNVQSGVHGVKRLTLPIPAISSPHTLIERRAGGDSAQVQAQKMDYKAHLRIIDGQVLNQAGSTVELKYCSGGGTYTGTCPGGQTVVDPLSTSSFYNFREGRTATTTNIDIAKLSASPNFQTLVNNNNGVVVYFSDRRNQGSATYQDSVRLINGSQLPTKGLTVASENPMYVKGNYNTGTKQPSGLVSDAFNVLSGNWNDANSTNTNLSGKTATATTIKSTVITGNKDTVTGGYNGGFENIHRMHENWSGQTLTFSGSVAVLYNSTIATGNWVYGGNYYTAPSRVWSFDTDLSNPSYSIPGLPSVFNVAKSGYEAT